MLVFGVIFGVLSKFEFGRKLLLNHPKIFSLGYFSHEGPSEDTMEKTKFSITFYGKGWPEKLSEPTDVHTTEPSKRMVTRVTGTNPGEHKWTFGSSSTLNAHLTNRKFVFLHDFLGYGATCVSLLLSATTILKQKEKLPARGGVFAPAACFAKTNLLEKLSKNGFKFEILSSGDGDDVKNIK